MEENQKVASGAETTTPQSLPTEVVDAMNRVFGKQTDNRAAHAKGIVVEGKFTPAPEAASLSKAPHFQKGVPVTIRFSNSPGAAAIPDAHPQATPRGIAIRFQLTDGTTDLLGHSFNGFPVRTADELRQFFVALATSGPEAAKPPPIEKFLAAHPTAKSFLESQKPPPVSYATLAYFGVNSFKFTNAKGEARFGRYRIDPEAGLHYLTPEEIAKAEPNYLSAEIRSRVSQGPVRFTVRVQLAEQGDKIDDPSIAWPDTRKTVDVGVIEITKSDPDSKTAEQALLFSPASVPEGIEPADPMIQVRHDAYFVSYQRRHH
jgi:catalase